VTAGTVNPITRKRYLGDIYEARTVRHSNAMLRSFYEFWIESGGGPLINPVPVERGNGRRANGHHNPLEPFRPTGRVRYNPKLPKRRPGEIPDEQRKELFAALRCARTGTGPSSLRHTRGTTPPGLHTAWDLLREVGVLRADLPLRRSVGRGQLTTA
jgi:hypothetical protein